jgi:DNA-binding response OmpR family regulator
MARILVIDDDDVMNDMLVQMLSQAGYEAEGARNGYYGLKLIEAKPFDLVITDIVMPEKEGLETITAIRKLGKSTPIIAISGGGRIGPSPYLLLAQHLGADYVFSKPFDKEPFLAAVRECLSGTPGTTKR